MAKLAIAAAIYPALVSAYTWRFTSQPTQCGNVTIAVNGGTPPFSVLVVPYGISPLPNNIEARKIQSIENQNGPDISFKLNFPANSQFVAVLSDKSGFASGGTSVGVLVTGSGDASCFDASKNVAPAFFYNIEPGGVIAQCVSTRIWWDPSAVQGTPHFQGVIPGGQSFEIPGNNPTTVPNQGLGFNWVPPLRGGTTLLLVSGDNRGNGSGGSSPYTVGSGPNNDNSCLNSDSPSSTPGNPAGGSYQTSTNAPSNNSGHETNVAAIAGGVVGGVVALLAICLIMFFFMRRRRLRAEEKSKIRPDLLQADEGDEGGASGVPQYYQPEPYLMAESTVGRSSLGGLTSDDRRFSQTDTDGRPLSTLLSDTASRSGTPDPSNMSSSTRKGPLRQMRPVNIIQHSDAGPSAPPATAEEEEPETVELPPAYTNINK
ncbi:hypothetical protein MIND_00147900 [Mycena indigotica]|uniref:Uncharacterized protein n=1 Tax=Mycena indigotica TaxID=2126181 RepID=A0A8H6WFZ9_9AGAR|nr:uncharacterized protein MIND_00147900 [Mycena indigotica]KAF7316292.1 hypothetical protein MIND_00147900 [Mycena indigotica]